LYNRMLYADLGKIIPTNRLITFALLENDDNR
jgi:hypothetical protein